MPDKIVVFSDNVHIKYAYQISSTQFSPCLNHLLVKTLVSMSMPMKPTMQNNIFADEIDIQIFQ